MTHRRRPRLPLLALVALGALAAHSPAAHAERDPAQLLYLCRPAQSSLRLMEVSDASTEEARQAAEGGEVTEVIQTRDLIKLAPENEEGYRLRLGSKVLTKTCGAFTVAITGGFLNSNPGGAEGVFTFPVVTITRHPAKPPARPSALPPSPLAGATRPLPGSVTPRTAPPTGRRRCMRSSVRQTWGPRSR